MRNKRGWIVWSLSRIGVMTAVLAMIIMTYAIYKYVSCVAASDSANKEAEDLAETIATVYSGPIGLETTYVLPNKIEGHEYNAIIINEVKRGILLGVQGTRCGTCSGAAPYNAMLASYPTPLKDGGEYNVTLNIKNLEDGVHIRKIDKCCNCIKITEFNYHAGDDCHNLNNEYVSFKNICDHTCNLTGWTVEDRIESRKPYRFPARTINSQSIVTLRTGCGTDTTTEAHWCSSGYPCNAIWNNEGDTLTLRESSGYKCLEYTYP